MPAAGPIVGFLTAQVARDRKQVASASDVLRAAMGDHAFVAIAAVAAFFDGMNRVVEGTGTYFLEGHDPPDDVQRAMRETGLRRPAERD